MRNLSGMHGDFYPIGCYTQLHVFPGPASKVEDVSPIQQIEAYKVGLITFITPVFRRYFSKSVLVICLGLTIRKNVFQECEDG